MISLVTGEEHKKYTFNKGTSYRVRHSVKVKCWRISAGSINLGNFAFAVAAVNPERKRKADDFDRALGKANKQTKKKKKCSWRIDGSLARPRT